MALSVAYTHFNGKLVYEKRGEAESFYVPDTLGSTAALTDASGNTTDTFNYWPYGETSTRTGQ